MYTLRRARRGALVSAAVLSLAFNLAACGGDGAEAEAEGTSEGVAVDPDVTFTGDPVKVMTMAPIETEVLDSGSMLEIAQGAVTALNNAGGLDGREVQLITCNEGFDPNIAADCARDAVAEGVSAVIGGFTIFAATVLPILEKAGIPWVGPPLTSNEELSHPASWPVGAGIMSMAALGARAVEDGCQDTVSVATQSGNEGSDQLAFLVNDGMISAGGEDPELVRVPQVVSDFSGVAEQLSDADCVVISAPPAVVTGIAAANASLGVTPNYYIFGGALTSAVIAPLGSALDGAITTSNYPVATDAAWDEARAAVGDLADDHNGGWSSIFAQNTWVAYQVFIDVASELDSFEPEDITAALESADSVEAGDLTPPIDFTDGYDRDGLERIFNRQLMFLTVQDAKLTPESDYFDLGGLLEKVS